MAALWIPGDFGHWDGWLPGPYEGDCLEKRSQRFTQVASLLGHAGVPGWTGSASSAYSDVVEQLIVAASQFAKNDTGMAALVKEQAAMVEEAQFGIAISQDALIAAIPVVMAMECKPTMLPLALLVAIVVANLAVISAIGLLIYCLNNSTDVADSAAKLSYQVPAWSLPIIGVESASPAGALAGPFRTESDDAAGHSGSAADRDVTTTASMPGPARAGWTALESSGIDAGRTGAVSPAYRQGPSVQSANRAKAGASLRDRSQARGPRVASVRDGSSISAHVTGAAGTSSGQRAPVEAALATAVGNADSRAEDPTHSGTQT
ncbi:EspA/EspE family type VII secretion system effector [Mycobacterium sp. 050134]|uniref:EspA/EspE family type VII secretion system effector n=1 Tax=Mycobacterium sp. 050134 TaxID=3096111 RepID=UPI002EDA332F